MVEPGRRDLAPAKPDSAIALDIAVRWAIRIAFLKHVLGLQHIQKLLDNACDHESSHDFPQLLRLTLEKGVHEPSTSARERVNGIIGAVPYWGESLEPVEWLAYDLAVNGRKILFDSTQFLTLLIAEYGVADLLGFCPLLAEIPSLSEKFATAFRTDAILSTYAAAIAGSTGSLWSQISYDPENEYLSRNFPPEGQHREYKATFRFDSKSGQKNANQQLACLKSIAGFLNADGGSLVIGVTDELKVIGLRGDFSLLSGNDPADAFIQVIHEAIKTKLSPIPIGLVEIAIRPCGSESVAVVTCRTSTTPIYLDDQLYVRDGNRTLRLNPEQTADFLAMKRTKLDP